MQSAQDKQLQDSVDAGESQFSVVETARNVISTVVTVDFFVVCFFLVWFLAGIATRSLTDNDAVQIAFNNQFSTLVQPALGILMIGSAAGAVFPEEDQEGNANNANNNNNYE